MRRRQVLATLGTASLAGCSSLNPSGADPEGTTTRQQSNQSIPEPNPKVNFSERILPSGKYGVNATVQLNGAEKLVIKDTGGSNITTITRSGTHVIAGKGSGMSGGGLIRAVVPDGIVGESVGSHAVGSKSEKSYPAHLTGLGGSVMPDTSVNGSYSRKYKQSAHGSRTVFSVNIPKSLYQYYEDRVRMSDYGAYVSDRYDQDYIKSLMEQVEKFGKRNDLTDRQLIDHVVSIIQNMKYTQDKATTGYNEYPRFPLETLVDRGGDCEDSCILLSQMLGQLGYGTVLLTLPGANHMALGVAGSDSLPGRYYEYEGQRYYYLETGGWGIGEVPSNVKQSNTDVKFYEVNSSPVLAFTWAVSVRTQGAGGAKTKITVGNVGDAPAKNASVTIKLKNPDQGVVAQKRADLPTIVPKSNVTKSITLMPPDDVPLRAHILAGVSGKLQAEDKSEVQKPAV